jgi:transcriptional regulator GlxA family with amidase domain
MKRRLGILLFDEVEVLDFAGPFEVFSVTNELSGDRAFEVRTVGVSPGPIRARNGLRVLPDVGLEACPPLEILVVPGGFGTRALLRDARTITWVRERAAAAEHVLSVCTGSLLLAEAGLLGGLTITTHHEVLDLLRERAPDSRVDPGRRFHDNGRIITAAGISAGIDASLHLVARLLGPGVAAGTASYMEYGPPAETAR